LADLFLYFLLAVIIYAIVINKINSRLELKFQKSLWSYAEKSSFFKFFVNTNCLNPITKEQLEEQFVFYRNYPPELKMFFCFRLERLMNTFTFITTDNSLIIDDQTKAVVLAQANRLTLGFRDYLYKACYTIELHPDIYFSEQTHQWHKGEVNTTGVIKLSTKWLLEGDLDVNDGVNLGIHEFAHAIMLDLFVGEEGNDFYENFMKYKQVARKHIDEIEQKKLFRDYAFTNDQEFFAVSTEVFFETPLVLLNQVPELYEAMCKLYNQKPHLQNPLIEN
jgi:hypothetical protein